MMFMQEVWSTRTTVFSSGLVGLLASTSKIATAKTYSKPSVPCPVVNVFKARFWPTSAELAAFLFHHKESVRTGHFYSAVAELRLHRSGDEEMKANNYFTCSTAHPSLSLADMRLACEQFMTNPLTRSKCLSVEDPEVAHGIRLRAMRIVADDDGLCEYPLPMGREEFIQRVGGTDESENDVYVVTERVHVNLQNLPGDEAAYCGPVQLRVSVAHFPLADPNDEHPACVFSLCCASERMEWAKKAVLAHFGDAEDARGPLADCPRGPSVPGTLVHYLSKFAPERLSSRVAGSAPFLAPFPLPPLYCLATAVHKFYEYFWMPPPPEKRREELRARLRRLRGGEEGHRAKVDDTVAAEDDSGDGWESACDDEEGGASADWEWDGGEEMERATDDDWDRYLLALALAEWCEEDELQGGVARCSKACREMRETRGDD